jgi:hypothetical protein
MSYWKMAVNDKSGRICKKWLWQILGEYEWLIETAVSGHPPRNRSKGSQDPTTTPSGRLVCVALHRHAPVCSIWMLIGTDCYCIRASHGICFSLLCPALQFWRYVDGSVRPRPTCSYVLYFPLFSFLPEDERERERERQRERDEARSRVWLRIARGWICCSRFCNATAALRCLTAEMSLWKSAICSLQYSVSSVAKYFDVFDWRPSLLGNRSRNSSMDTLTTPVLLRCMVTNSRRANVSIVSGTVLKREDNTQS